MRVPDTILQSNFLRTLTRNKSSLAEIQYQLTTQSKVNRPSDNPLSNSRILRLQNQLSSIYTYKSNITYGSSMIDDSILSIESMQEEVQNILVELTKLNSDAVNNDLTPFAEGIDASLNILLELANSDFNGQYNFAGTESGTKPFYYDEANKRVIVNPTSIGGDKYVKISSSITQKFNINGKDLFQSVFSQTGNLDSSAGIGVAQPTSTSIYDAEGNEYTLNMNYTMTDTNTYEMTYSIVDSDSNVIQTDTINDIKFNSETGKFESVDGSSIGEIHIENSANKIDFVIDPNSLKESDSAANLTGSLNQKADIFNTLIAIREKLLAGEKPTAEQSQMVADFNKHLLNELSSAGTISNKLDSTEAILLNREIEVTDLLSMEKDVDVARALLDLENAQYVLDLSYKISSMILPSSLLDYM